MNVHLHVHAFGKLEVRSTLAMISLAGPSAFPRKDEPHVASSWGFRASVGFLFLLLMSQAMGFLIPLLLESLFYLFKGRGTPIVGINVKLMISLFMSPFLRPSVSRHC